MNCRASPIFASGLRLRGANDQTILEACRGELSFGQQDLEEEPLYQRLEHVPLERRRGLNTRQAATVTYV
jgi:hypothetical protein